MGGLAVRRGGGRLTPAPRRQGAADASENPIADALTRPAAARLPARRQLALRINVDRPCAGPTVDAVLLGYVRVSTDTGTRPIRWTPAPAPASPRMTSSQRPAVPGAKAGLAGRNLRRADGLRWRPPRQHPLSWPRNRAANATRHRRGRPESPVRARRRGSQSPPPLS